MRRPRLADYELALGNPRSILPGVLSLFLGGLAVAITLDVDSDSISWGRSLGIAAISALAVSVLLGLEGSATAGAVVGLTSAVVTAGGADEVAILHLALVGVLWFLAADAAIASVELRLVGDIPGPLVWPFAGGRIMVAVGAVVLASTGGLLADWAPLRSVASTIIGAVLVLLVLHRVMRPGGRPGRVMVE
ncbi:MAG: hypothetical protein GY745_02330 [Actinomycetia bacterium]|nr:hypothetical protein [Actinomycetes bacterium]MCP4083887.1 hypothetical protein [Actinomycetes bacterium]